MGDLVWFNPPVIQEMEFQHEIQAINRSFEVAAAFVDSAINERLEAGRMLVKLRKDVEDRGYDWWPWYRQAGFVRGRKDAEKVIALANDRDPEAAAEQERERNREAVRKHRAAQPKVTAYVSGSDAEGEEVSEVEAAEQVATNVLDTIKRQTAVANAYRKIFKASSFDKEAKAEIRSAIEALMSKWQAALRLVPVDEDVDVLW